MQMSRFWYFHCGYKKSSFLRFEQIIHCGLLSLKFLSSGLLGLLYTKKKRAIKTRTSGYSLVLRAGYFRNFLIIRPHFRFRKMNCKFQNILKAALLEPSKYQTLGLNPTNSSLRKTNILITKPCRPVYTIHKTTAIPETYGECHDSSTYNLVKNMTSLLDSLVGRTQLYIKNSTNNTKKRRRDSNKRG